MVWPTISYHGVTNWPTNVYNRPDLWQTDMTTLKILKSAILRQYFGAQTQTPGAAFKLFSEPQWKTHNQCMLTKALINSFLIFWGWECLLQKRKTLRTVKESSGLQKRFGHRPNGIRYIFLSFCICICVFVCSKIIWPQAQCRQVSYLVKIRGKWEEWKRELNESWHVFC